MTASCMPSRTHQDLTTSQPGVLEPGDRRKSRDVCSCCSQASACGVGRFLPYIGPRTKKVAFMRIPA